MGIDFRIEIDGADIDVKVMFSLIIQIPDSAHFANTDIDIANNLSPFLT